jgi:hypothetical protein
MIAFSDTLHHSAGLGRDVIEGRASVPAGDDELEVGNEVRVALNFDVAGVVLTALLVDRRSATWNSASMSSKSSSFFCLSLLFFLFFGILHGENNAFINLEERAAERAEWFCVEG